MVARTASRCWKNNNGKKLDDKKKNNQLAKKKKKLGLTNGCVSDAHSVVLTNSLIALSICVNTEVKWSQQCWFLFIWMKLCQHSSSSLHISSMAKSIYREHFHPAAHSQMENWDSSTETGAERESFGKVMNEHNFSWAHWIFLWLVRENKAHGHWGTAPRFGHFIPFHLYDTFRCPWWLRKIRFYSLIASTFSLNTDLWGLQESLAVGVLAGKAPEHRPPVDRASEGKASEGKDQGRSLGLLEGSLAAHSQLLVGTVPQGPGCSWEGACRNLAEGVHKCCYEVGWSHPYQGIRSYPGTWCEGSLTLLQEKPVKRKGV